MTNIKVTISLPPNLLEATDKVAKLDDVSRSALIATALKNYPDIYDVWSALKEANKAVNNE